MKEKWLNKNKIIIIIFSIFISVVIIFGGLYIKKKNDIDNYKKFYYDYTQLNNKISSNETAYSNYIKAIQNYITVFMKYEGKAKVNDVDKDNINKSSTDYLGYIESLKKLSPPKELQDDYKNLIELYEKDNIHRENINRDLKNNNGKNIKSEELETIKDLTKFRNDFESKIVITSKQKGIDIEEINAK
jgi:hypothetical protein